MQAASHNAVNAQNADCDHKCLTSCHVLWHVQHCEHHAYSMLMYVLWCDQLACLHTSQTTSLNCRWPSAAVLSAELKAECADAASSIIGAVEAAYVAGLYGGISYSGHNVGSRIHDSRYVHCQSAFQACSCMQCAACGIAGLHLLNGVDARRVPQKAFQGSKCSVSGTGSRRCTELHATMCILHDVATTPLVAPI
jgi:hypothetical protein